MAAVDGTGKSRLTGYVTGSVTSGTELRKYLAARLPVFLVPPVIAVLDRLPLTPNGKIDRAGTPAVAPAGSGEAAGTVTEELLAGLRVPSATSTACHVLHGAAGRVRLARPPADVAVAARLREAGLSPELVRLGRDGLAEALHRLLSFQRAKSSDDPGRTDFPLTVFRAPGSGADERGHFERRRDLAPKTELVEIPGDHLSVMTPPSLEPVLGDLHRQLHR